MTVLDLTNPTPLYLRLATLFYQRIQKGIWRQHDLLPTIEQLMQEFDVARVTVRQAINLLARDGILRSTRGKGIEVIKNIAQPKYLKLETSLSEMSAVYRTDRPSLTMIDEKSKHPIYLLPDEGIPANEYRHLRRVHTRNGEAYCVISIFLSEDIFKMKPSRFRKETVIPVLLDLDGVEIHSAKQFLKLGCADIEVSELLNVPVNSPVAEVRRLIKDKNGVVLYMGEITYKADHVNFEMDLKV